MVNALTASMIIDSVLIPSPHCTRSQKYTYPIERAKNAIVTAIQSRSSICVLLSDTPFGAPHHEPSLLPHHQISPAVTVLCSFLNVLSVRKKGRFEKSRRHSIRLMRPAPRLYSYVSVVSDRKSTRLNSSHSQISYAVFCLKKKHLCLISSYLFKADFPTVSLARVDVARKLRHVDEN